MGGDRRPTADGTASRRTLHIDPFFGASLVVFTKGLDAATTLVALLFFPGVREGNPFVVLALDVVGTVPGVLLLSALGVAGIVFATESVVAVVDETADESPDLIRLVGYVPASTFFFLVAVNNALVVVTRL